MKFSAFAAIAASAALVSASPLRVIVVSSTSVERPVDFPGAVRFGHAVPEIPRPAFGWAPGMPPPVRAQRKGPCMKGIFKQKAINVSNSFRKIFGFPPIEQYEQHEIPHGKEIHGGLIRIMPFVPEGGRPLPMPMPHVEGPVRGGNDWRGRTEGGNEAQPVRNIVISHPYDNGHVRIFHHYQGQNFFARIQNAIMSLGPWEGRAVAFVLGCGIGVLLRMFFVLSIVLYRSLRGSDEEHEYEEVLVFEVDENVSRRAPPPYIYPVDEKVAVEAPAQAETARD
ncbi:hypothetical protein BKA70DRAFT_1372465 [Coprinopsis sp. MPI-PUGE-AT-0042]|nr:hypothetical protein BKA70DRAFT_1372465 [Coprinopsis sp. MPI-PUGE-AT-0042]